jgi:hypothetical protein
MFYFYLFIFETESYYVAKAGFKLVVPLPLLPTCLDYMHVPSNPHARMFIVEL